MIISFFLLISGLDRNPDICLKSAIFPVKILQIWADILQIFGRYPAVFGQIYRRFWADILPISECQVFYSEDFENL